jgi:hypothetical protein
LSISANGETILLHCFADCSFADIVMALGLRGSDLGRRSERVDPARAAKIAEMEEQRRQYVDRILSECRSILEGGPVDRYLRSRGFVGPWPDDFREHPRLRHSVCKREHAALVARVRNIHGFVTSIHRIFLTPDGRKVECKPCKMLLGASKGGAIRLGPITPVVALCEGPEDALAVQHAKPGVSAWSCLSSTLMQQLQLPPEIRHVAIVPDRDRTGIEAARILCDRLRHEGRSVDFWWPKEKDAAASWEMRHAQ